MIYLDYAATSLRKPQCVIDAVTQAMQQFGNAGRGAHEGALSASRLIYETRYMVAELFDVGGAEQVAFTANATASLNMAIQGIFCPGDHVITTQMEHNSVLRPLYHMEALGMDLTVVATMRSGRSEMIHVSQVEAAITPRTRAVVCTHASNVTGDMIDLKQIGELCRRHDLLFIVDASQTAGIFPISMQDMNIDVLCFTGHKGLLGPQGIGGICVRNGVQIRPLLMGGSGVQSYSKEHPNQMPTVLEAGTVNGPGIAGLHAALTFIGEQGIESLRKKELNFMWQFYDGIHELPGIQVYGDFANRTVMRAPIVSWNLKDYDAGAVADELAQRYQIAVRAGAHCAPLIHQAYGTEVQGMVRMSFSSMNEPEDVIAAIHAVRELAEEG